MSQLRESLSAYPRIGINGRTDDTGDPCGDKRIGAGRRYAMMRTRLERDINGTSFRALAGLFEGSRFGMGPPARIRPSASHDHTVF
jgi:hypothetical protein